MGPTGESPGVVWCGVLAFPIRTSDCLAVGGEMIREDITSASVLMYSQRHS
jgi:hypothetical protein